MFEENRKKFLSMLKDFVGDIPKGAIILMKSKEPLPIDATGTDYPVRKDRYGV